jgi:hypothetical protein
MPMVTVSPLAAQTARTRRAAAAAKSGAVVSLPVSIEW